MPPSHLLHIIILATLSQALIAKSRVTRLKVQELPAIATTSDSYLSVALDSGVIANGFWPLDFTDKRLIALARGLGPAYLRYFFWTLSPWGRWVCFY